MNKIYFALAAVLVAMLSLITFAAHVPHGKVFWAIVGLGVAALVLMAYLYQRIMRPMHIIGSGMQLLREQDFSSRLRNVGEPEADKIVEIFNQMMAELKEERLRLLERNHLLDLLIEVSPMGVVMLDFDGHITSLNPAAMQYLEGSEDDKGKTFSELHNDLAVRIGTLKDNTTGTFSMNNGNIYRCTRSAFLDRGFHHPFVLIEHLTQEVMGAERDAYGKVIRMISHEVNNTMASIGSIMETVSEELKSVPNAQELTTALQACMGRSREMSAFITRFADVVKLPDPSLQEMSLNSLVTANLQFMESLCHAHGITLQTDLCSGSPIVKMDVALMTQVLVNIVKNSIESINEKGENEGCITITTTASPISIMVTDNGTGISSETEQKLFTPFFSTKPNGNGIGLLLVREILTRHRFPFSLKTESDGLTKFRIQFPVCKSLK